MKRKSEARVNGKSKKRAISDDEAHKNFRKGLFDTTVLKDYTDSYTASQPYVNFMRLQARSSLFSPDISTP